MSALLEDPVNTSADERNEDPSAPEPRVLSHGIENVRRSRHRPVNVISYQDVRDLENLHQQGNEHHGRPIRPFTSMDGPGEDQNLSGRGIGRHSSLQFRRQDRSTENAGDDPALEIAMARSRLRSIVPRQEPAQDMPEPPRGRASTIDELNVMLDDAIKDSSPKPEISPDDQPASLAPKPGFVLRRASTRQDRHRSKSRVSRKTTESVEPRTSEESTRVQYDGSEMAYQSPQEESVHETTFTPRSPLKPTSQAASQLHPTARPITELSPVKQRAAIFGGLSKNAQPTGHDSVCRHFGHEHDPTHDHVHHHPGPQRKEPKKVHRIKFGDRIEERPATPLIPLTLPTPVTQEKTTRPPSAAAEIAETKHEMRRPVETVAEESTSDDVFKEASHERKSSLNWPFKWSIFNKGASVPPQETVPTPVEVEAKDEHYPSTRPSFVQSKVQEILQAAEKKDDAEKQRRDAERGRLTRRNTRPRPPSRRPTVTKPSDVMPEAVLEPMSNETAKNQLLSQGRKPAPSSEEKPKTPLQRAMSEKQVLPPPARPEYDSSLVSSPQKSLPQTPVRGRPSLAHRPTPDQKHSVEKQFNLSPERSMSRQRQGVKVEVEIRDSPDREARERGDKIVIIRADVASDMGDEEN